MRTENYQEYKDRLRGLVLRMDTCSAEEGMPLLDDFVKDYEASLYNEIGRLTRQLHDALNTFNDEEKILNLTEKDIPSAKERLRYVVTVTEQATQNVLAIVEKSLPMATDISARAERLYEKSARLIADGDDRGGISNFMGEVHAFLLGAKDNCGVLHGHFTEIMMAQEYQDITGQIIKKVIALVQDVEDSLVRLIKMTGHKVAAESDKRNDALVSGPMVPGVDAQGDYAAGQDDVDNLLASLGF